MAFVAIDRVGVLRQTELFRHFSNCELLEMSHHAIPRRLKRDEPLVFEGEESSGLFVLAEGSMRIYREGVDGREQVIRLVNAVDTLGELPLFDGRPHPASITASTDSLILCVQYPQWRQKLVESQYAVDALELMARHLRETVDLVHSLSLLDVHQRLAQYLLDQAQGRGVRHADGIHFDLAISNSQIGAIVGAVREVISRALTRLQKEGLIVLQGRHVVIPDDRALSGTLRCNLRHIA